MTTIVQVSLGSRSYEIAIGEGLLARLDALCGPWVKDAKVLLVSDASVAPLYAKACATALQKTGCNLTQAVVPAGEGSKDGHHLFQLYSAAVNARLDRQSVVLALGGGVVGDLAGFMAASYLRGLKLIQLPTTLLSMVDSAVGGKTGINLPQGKNLVGAFHQPSLVVCDVDTLKSLPPRERAAGMAEVIKYGVIYDAELFRLLEANMEKILEGDPALLTKIIARSCEIKADVVAKDEHEMSLRAILNFGHTLGHAVEAVAGYGKYLHGEAVGIGMNFAGRLSMYEKGFPEADYQRLHELIQRAGLPVRAPDLPWEALSQAVSVDKKVKGGKAKFVLATRIGTVEYGCAVEAGTVEKVWKEL